MSIITAVTGVFDEISTWLIGAIQDVTQLFYVPETGLTLLGVLALMSLGISVIFLISYHSSCAELPAFPGLMQRPDAEASV